MKSKVLVIVRRVLPDELVLQILSRIPIKSIHKFKSVCKSWYKLLSGNYFINLYDQLSMRNPSTTVLIEIFDSSRVKPKLFCVDSLTGVNEIDLDFIKDSVRIRGSRNGLLWCSSLLNEGACYVCNPTTRKFKVLSAISEKETFPVSREGRLIMGIVPCDLLINPNSSVALRAVNNSFDCVVYDSETSKWNKFSTLQDDNLFQTYIDCGLFQGQIVYLDCSIYCLIEGSVYILVLDSKSGPEGISRIRLPVKVTNTEDNWVLLLEFDGLLSVVQFANALLTIWVLKDIKHVQTWEVVEKLSSRRIRPMVPYIYQIFQSGDYMVFATDVKAVIYNRSTKVWADLFTARDGCFISLRFITRSFRSSLVSLYD